MPVRLRDQLVADAEGFDVHRRQHESIRMRICHGATLGSWGEPMASPEPKPLVAFRGFLRSGSKYLRMSGTRGRHGVLADRAEWGAQPVRRNTAEYRKFRPRFGERVNMCTLRRSLPHPALRATVSERGRKPGAALITGSWVGPPESTPIGARPVVRRKPAPARGRVPAIGVRSRPGTRSS